MTSQQQQYVPPYGQTYPQYPQQQQQQFIVFNPNQRRDVITRPPVKVKYSDKNIKSVRGLTASQLAIGLTVFVFHAITTAINDHFFNQIAIYKKSPYNLDFGYYYEEELVDHASTGIWVGLLIILTAALGLAGAKQQKKSLIVAHLIFNVILVIVVPVLIGTVSATIGGLNSCRSYGLGGYRYYDDYSYNSGRHTTGAPILFYGETLYRSGYSYSSSDTKFHCSAHIFKAWLAMDGIILVSGIFGWIISLTLLVYNSIAACMGCCRGCCCSCCCSAETNEDNNMVAYVAQPSTQTASGTHMVTPGQVHIAQPTFVPPQYAYQPTPLYTQPGVHQQAPVQYVTQPVGAPVITTQPTVTSTGTPGTTVHGTPVGASAAPEDSKWQDLPPEYAEVLQNSQNQANQQQ